MTRFAGDRPRAAFSMAYEGSAVGNTRRADDATTQEGLRAGRRSRYALRGYDKENPRAKKPELENSTAMTERRDGTIAARKAKEEEARLKSLYG